MSSAPVRRTRSRGLPVTWNRVIMFCGIFAIVWIGAVVIRWVLFRTFSFTLNPAGIYGLAIPGLLVYAQGLPDDSVAQSEQRMAVFVVASAAIGMAIAVSLGAIAFLAFSHGLVPVVTGDVYYQELDPQANAVWILSDGSQLEGRSLYLFLLTLFLWPQTTLAAYFGVIRPVFIRGRSVPLPVWPQKTGRSEGTD